MTAADERGRFITFEGGEGAGKSTQVTLLAARLRAAGKSVVTTREPGGSPGAEQIRTLIVTGAGDRWDGMTEALLIAAARRDHVRSTIAPALARGDWVICDRFFDSTLAYQGYGRGLPLADLDQLRRLAVGTLTPDLTLMLDLPVEDGLTRAKGRSGAEVRFEGLDLAFHQRLRAGFHAILEAEPARCRLVPATGSIEDVAGRVWAALCARFPGEGLS